MTKGVYLIHFTQPYKHARHYVGWSENIEARIELHQQGKGARLCEVVVAAGIDLLWARTWVGADRHLERKIHNRGKSLYCPICNRHGWKHHLPQVEIELTNNQDVDFSRRTG